jgi:hypothetical protein
METPRRREGKDPIAEYGAGLPPAGEGVPTPLPLPPPPPKLAHLQAQKRVGLIKTFS